MKRELRDKWVVALRSGDYKQGQGALHNTKNEFCCLGVLCDIAGIESRLAYTGANTYAYGKTGGTGYLPKDFAESVGLDHSDSDYLQRELSRRNDTGYDFNQIAAWIEENVPVED